MKKIVYIEHGGYEVELLVSFEIENDGIGDYEYWGFKYYDAGTNYPVVDEIIVTDEDISDELKADIHQCIEDSNHEIHEEILSQIIETHD